MTKARTLGNFVSAGNPLADGTIAASEVTGLSTVATSGSYNDLSDKPTITTTATNIAGGSNGSIPYQSASGTTQMLAAGTAGQFLQTNGAAAPTWVTPTSDGARFTAVASGTLSNGRMVNLNDDGTVTMVGETTTVYPDNIPSGSATIFNNSVNFNQASIAFNKNTANQFMLCYFDTVASRLQAVVGTVSDSTISFGTEVTVDNFVEPSNIDICHVTGTTDRYVMVWRGSGEDGWSIVASVSGTTISLGGAVQWATTSTYCVAVASGPNSGQIAVTSINNNNGNYGTAYVGSVSGTSISWGSGSVFESVNCLGPMAIAFDPFSSSRLFIMYRPNDTGYGQIRIGSVSGTSISSWSSAYPWFSANELSENYGLRVYAMAFDRVTANSFVVAWKNIVTNVNQMKAATHNGSSITYGTAVTFNSTDIQGDIGLCMNETIAGSFVMSYSSTTTTFARPFTISGTTITLGTEATLQSAASGSTKVVADEGTARKFIGVYKNNTTNVGYAYTGTIGYSVVTNNLSATKFIGVCDGSYTNGQTATIQAKYGINPNQTGLTTNSTYYVQTNGTLSTTAASPSVLAGRALSSTKLLIGAI
jgi:hypothetical protein